MSASDKPDGATGHPVGIPQDVTGSKNLKLASFPLVKTLVAALLVSLAAGFVAWNIAEKIRVQEVVQNKGKYGGARLSVEAATRNGGVFYGLVGALLGLGLGVVSGFMSNDRSQARPMLGAIAGTLLGAMGGAASSYALSPSYFIKLEDADLTRSILIHLGIWASVGAGAGIAFGLGSGSWGLISRSLVGGVTGAALAALLLDIGGSMMPLAHTERPLSEESGTRLAASLLLVACVSLGTVGVAAQEPRDVAKKI